MSGNVMAEDKSELRKSLNKGFAKTELERRGKHFDTGAPVTGAVSLGDAVAVSFGDGRVQLFRPNSVSASIKAHDGVILCMAAGEREIVTGGDDGRFLSVSIDGSVREIANFGTKWVDCVAMSHELVACSSGKNVYIWTPGETECTSLEHNSTVGGLAFDTQGKRLAVSNYGGVTLWERNKRRWKSTRLAWKGSHGALTFSPDGKYVITAMQENALHGWKLFNKANLAMSGYPAKVKSFAWVGDAPHLATSGADQAVCWPFDGKDGPMNRKPLCVANGGKQIATCVQALPQEKAVFAGFEDGTVILSELDETKEPIVIRGRTGIEVSAIAISPSQSHILIGDMKGHVLWSQLWSGDAYAGNV